MEWIKTSERLPDERTDVLFMSGGERMIGQRGPDFWWAFPQTWCKSATVTHWAPIDWPDPPKE